MLSYVTWNVDPELFTVFGREIRWYGMLWVIGLIVAVFIVQRIFDNEKHPERWFDSLFVYMMFGIILGARLGHCLFYEPAYYLSHPLEITPAISPCLPVIRRFCIFPDKSYKRFHSLIKFLFVICVPPAS